MVTTIHYIQNQVTKIDLPNLDLQCGLAAILALMLTPQKSMLKGVQDKSDLQHCQSILSSAGYL